MKKKQKLLEFEEDLRKQREEEEKQILAEFERKRVSEREKMFKEEMEWQRLQFEAKAVYEAEQLRIRDEEEKAMKIAIEKQKREEAERKRKEEEEKVRNKLENQYKNICGFLAKKGHLRTNWNIRYFVIKEKELIYYVDNSREKQKGQENLTNCNVEKVERDQRKYCLLMKLSTKKEYLLAAGKEEEQDEWYVADYNWNG